MIHVEALTEEVGGGLIKDEECGEGDADRDAARGNAEVIAVMRAAEESFANGAAWDIVSSGDLDVQVRKSRGDGLLKLSNSFRSVELPQRHEIKEGAIILNERRWNVGPPVFVFETDVIGDSGALLLKKVHRRCSWKWRWGKKLVIEGRIVKRGAAANHPR